MGNSGNKPTFQKRVEDFTCEVCSVFIKGTGYTDHCPKCLWSKHVDVSPGDRTEKCQGLMEPKYVIQEGGEWRVVYQCNSCRKWHICDTASNDSREKIIELSSRPVPDDVLSRLKKKG